MTLLYICLIGVLQLHFFCIRAGPLHDKAEQYDNWNAKHNQPFYGGQLAVNFTDNTYEKAFFHYGYDDSVLWTGVYLGSQALRYALTADPRAKENAIKAVKTLDGNLHVTGAKGYIARYWGSQKSFPYYSDAFCESFIDCHKITKGKYAGDFWMGSTTSKDQYSGWFFGMSLAYSYIDDQETKRIIKEDVLEIVDTLIEHNWIILNEKGKYNPYSAIAKVSDIYQIAWLLTALDVSQDPKYKTELDKRLSWYALIEMEIGTFASVLNRYIQYYAYNLAHVAWYAALRLAGNYTTKAMHARLKAIFTNRVHSKAVLTHNPWFTAIFMAEGNYNFTNGAYKKQLIEDLTTFRPAPNYSYYLPKRNPTTYKLDPVISWLKYFPWLDRMMHTTKFGLDPQALEAFPVNQQCYADFMFQKNPYLVSECGEDQPKLVQPGIDFIAPYWLSVFHGLIDINQ